MNTRALTSLSLTLAACLSCSGSPKPAQHSTPPQAGAQAPDQASDQAPTQAQAEPKTWRAKLSFDGGKWRLRYTFPEPVRALLFDSAHGEAYRATSWAPKTPGVSIEHLQGLDALLCEEPTSVVDFDLNLPKEAPQGTLAIVPFSDGTHALWSGQLALLTVESRAAAEALHGDLRAWRGEQPPVEIELTSSTPLIGPQGAATRHVVTAHQGRGAYIYMGKSEDPKLIVDPGLPQWVQRAFRTRMPQVKQLLDTSWAHQIPDPQLMLAWGGDQGPWSNRGRAEGAQIVMVIKGAEYAAPNDQRLGDLIWFFAHEMSHLHQFRDKAYGEPWMIEGFADTMATEVLVKLGLWDKRSLERRYWSITQECARELSKGALTELRGRASYVCGDLVGVALMKLLPDHSLAALWRGAVGIDRRVSLKTLRQAALTLGVSATSLEALEQFITTKHPDPDKAIAVMLEAATLKPQYANGGLSSMDFPFSPQGKEAAKP